MAPGSTPQAPALKVKELYPAIMGESSLAGLPCTIIRLSGCNLRCSYCDTAYAYEGGRKKSLHSLVAAAARHGHELALVTGGEPMVQKDTPELLDRLAGAGIIPVLETNGSADLARVPAATHVVMDVKTPGSGCEGATLLDNLDKLKKTDEIKLVLTDRKDYLWARRLVKDRGLDERFGVTFSPAHGALAPGDLARWILKDRLKARLGIQIHKYIFGPGAVKA